MTIVRYVRPLGALAVLLLAAVATTLALSASTAHAQEPGQEPGQEPDGELPELEGLPELEQLPDLEGLDLQELLDLLNLLAQEEPEAPAPAPEPAPVAPPPLGPPPPASAATVPQVTQRPVGAVAAGAGGASQHGPSTWPLLVLGALTLTGASAALKTQGVRA